MDNYAIKGFVEQLSMNHKCRIATETNINEFACLDSLMSNLINCLFLFFQPREKAVISQKIINAMLYFQ